MKSISRWIIETAKFIYETGHPLYDDDEKFSLITKRFNQVFLSLTSIIFKTILLILWILAWIGISSSLLYFLRNGTLFSINSSSDTFLNLYPSSLFKWPFISGTILPIFIAPIFFRRNSHHQKDTYSPIDQLLHYVFIGNSNISKFIFRIEKRLFKRNLTESSSVQSVYISGLARAGTTALLQYIGDLSDVRSLSYKNMPFIFSPNLWSRLSSKRKTKEREREHKDGVMHSLESYEGLEEVFWRNYTGKKYIQEDRLEAYEINKDEFDHYNSFRKLIAHKKIYLAKNNNHLLRASSLHLFDTEVGNETQTIIPFRNPYSQANSLLTQHKHLSKLQSENPFFKDYMDFLAHYEFGLSHKVSTFNKNDSSFENLGDPNTIDYWLEVWNVFYSQVLSLYSNKKGFHFFCYEEFCVQPRKSLESLLPIIGLSKLDLENINIESYTPKEVISEDATSKYSALYRNLLSQSIN